MHTNNEPPPADSSPARGEKVEAVRSFEEKLRVAMLNGDVVELETLLADDLIFVAHTGQTFGKSDDLQAHREKMFSLSRLDFIRQDIRPLGNLFHCVTSVSLEGEWGGQAFDDTIVYTRLWRQNGEGAWQVAAGQATRWQV